MQLRTTSTPMYNGPNSARQNNSPVSMPLINRSENLYPVIGRLENKKESLSADEYDKSINEQLEYFSY